MNPCSVKQDMQPVLIAIGLWQKWPSHWQWVSIACLVFISHLQMQRRSFLSNRRVDHGVKPRIEYQILSIYTPGRGSRNGSRYMFGARQRAPSAGACMAEAYLDGPHSERGLIMSSVIHTADAHHTHNLCGAMDFIHCPILYLHPNLTIA